MPPNRVMSGAPATRVSSMKCSRVAWRAVAAWSSNSGPQAGPGPDDVPRPDLLPEIDVGRAAEIVRFPRVMATASGDPAKSTSVAPIKVKSSLIGNGEDDAAVGRLENIGAVVVEQLAHDDMAAAHQAQARLFRAPGQSGDDRVRPGTGGVDQQARTQLAFDAGSPVAEGNRARRPRRRERRGLRCASRSRRRGRRRRAR